MKIKVDKLYKIFNKHEKEKIENSYFDYLKNFLDDYGSLNTDWLARRLLLTVLDAIHSLKREIDNPKEKDITWNAPYCELQYPVAIDWNKLNTGYVSHTANASQTNSDKPQDFINTQIKKLLAERGQTLFSTLTRDIVFVKNNNQNSVLIPQELSNTTLPLSDCEDKISLMKLATKEFYINLDKTINLILDKIKELGDSHINDYIDESVKDIEGLQERLWDKKNTEGKLLKDFINSLGTGDKEYYQNYFNSKEFMNGMKVELSNFVMLIFSGLHIDLDKREAYYPVYIELNLPSISMFSEESIEAIFNVLFGDINKELERMLGREKIPVKSVGDRAGRESFSIPSTEIMLTLIMLFAGRPELIPRRALEKPYNNLTKADKEARDKFLNSIFQESTDFYYDDNGHEINKSKTIAILSNNQKVRAVSEEAPTLFKDGVIQKEHNLAIYIKKTFGAEGLRHLLAILIGLDESGRTGEFYWNVNEHLTRLGYARKNGSYQMDLKENALEIVKILTGCYISITKLDEEGTGIEEGRLFFYIEGYQKRVKEFSLKEKYLIIKTTDFWYKNSYENTRGASSKYTKLLKDIVKENHSKHPYTIYLGTLLAIFWRMNKKQEFKVSNLMKWCDITQNKRYKENLRKLEEEFDYMIKCGYLGHWETKEMNVRPSETKDPLNCVLVFYPPEWLQKEVELISDKRTQYLEKQQSKELMKEYKLITKDELKSLIQMSNLTQKDFADKVSIDPSLISHYLKGRRKINAESTMKIRSVFGN